jgi:hypothetical protein
VTSTAVHVNTTTYAATHVATNMLGRIRSIVKGSGLNPDLLRDQWPTLERGIETWLTSCHLKTVTLEVFDPGKRPSDFAGRFDFSIDYGYYPGGDGDLWLDPDTVAHAIRKNGTYAARCQYRIVIDCAPGYPPIPGWAATTYRSTEGFTRHTVGTALGGGNIGAGLSYYTRSGS